MSASITLSQLMAEQGGRLYLSQARQLVLDIGRDIDHYKRQKRGVVAITTDTIHCYDRQRFGLADTCDTSVLEDDQILIICPLDRSNPFLSPELRSLTKLPSRISNTSIYYSVGCLVLYSLTGKNTIEHVKELGHIPISYFIERCMKTDPFKRHYLYI